MLTAEKVSKLSAQSPAWRRKAWPAATWPRAAVRFGPRRRTRAAGRTAICLSGALERRPRRASRAAARPGRSRQVDGVQCSSALPAWPVRPPDATQLAALAAASACLAPNGRTARLAPGAVVPRRNARAAVTTGGSRDGGVGAPAGGGPGGALATRGWGVPQAARILAASSFRPATARFTSRRAASAVTPRSSPTSRKLWRRRRGVRSGLHGEAGPLVEGGEELVEQLVVDLEHHGVLGACPDRWGSGRRAWCRRRRPRCGRARPAWTSRWSRALSASSSSPSPEAWRRAARRLAERSPGRRTRLAFWSRARPMAWRIQKVA